MSIKSIEKTLNLFLGLVTFVITLVAVCIEKWAVLSNNTSIGLWSNVDIGAAEMEKFDGLEIVRGCAVISVAISFLFLVFSIYSFIGSKSESKFWNSDVSFGSIFSSGACTAYIMMTSIIMTSLSKDAGAKMSTSLQMFWAGFAISMLQTSFLFIAWRKLGREIGRVDVDESKDENKDRGNWDSHHEYMLSMVGYAVGLGNVWRFPYLCYEHGGGAFLIPYVIMLIFLGLPVFFMECAIGQFDSRGPIESWNISPAFRGIGWMMVLYSGLTGIYYNVIIAYSVYYFFSSLTSDLPWADCDNYWNSGNCEAGTFNVTDKSQASPAEDYYRTHMLKEKQFDDEGSHDIVWQIVVVLLIAWTVVFFSLIKGIKSSGKVVWFTCLFPYIVIIIMVIKGALLEGHEKGVAYYIGSQSDLSKLSNGKVWKDAASQIFFSLSAGWGGVQALSSYNKFHNNCFRDSIIVALSNCATSFVAGFAIFTVVGHMADVYNVSVPEVTQGGFSLVFIAYPTALAKFAAASPFFACLFFLMLFTLGLDSQFTILETVATAICDTSKWARERRTLTMGLVSIVSFLIALLCCTNAGLSWVNLIDSYVGGWAILVSTCLEVLVLGTVYGGGIFAWCGWFGEERLVEDVEMMIGKRSAIWWFFWKLCWYFISPVLMAGLLIWNWVIFEAQNIPDWANAIGWVLIGIGFLSLPVYAIIELFKARKEGRPLLSIFKPNDRWGPCNVEHQTGRYAGKVFKDY